MTSFFRRIAGLHRVIQGAVSDNGFNQLQEVGAFGAILIESLRQSKSAGSNLSREGKNITVHIQDGGLQRGLMV